jgi:hypothetical protein
LLSREPIKQLEAVGFQWTYQPPSPWDASYAALKNYHDQHGHCKVPFNWPENAKLARWVATQRAQGRKGQLAAERMKRLTAIGFRW